MTQALATVRSLIVNDAHELLVVRRSQSDTHHPGAWEMPGGRVEPGEDFIPAVQRETLEETGLQLHEPRVVYATTEPRQDGSRTYLFFAENILGQPAVTLSYEHDAYKWVALDEIFVVITYDMQVAMLHYVLEHDLLY
jgi:8-oxo-dGTP diphosphatase